MKVPGPVEQFLKGRRIAVAGVFLLVCAGLFAACRVSYQPPPEPAPVPGGPPYAAAGGETWLYLVPRQCLSNPWEKAWREAHPEGTYPNNPDTPGPDPAEVAIIESYYSGYGVSILETTTVLNDAPRCAACSCPAEYRVYIRVRDRDIPVMEKAGFRRFAQLWTDGQTPQDSTNEDSTAVDQ